MPKEKITPKWAEFSEKKRMFYPVATNEGWVQLIVEYRIRDSIKYIDSIALSVQGDSSITLNKLIRQMYLSKQQFIQQMAVSINSKE